MINLILIDKFKIKYLSIKPADLQTHINIPFLTK